MLGSSRTKAALDEVGEATPAINIRGQPPLCRTRVEQLNAFPSRMHLGTAMAMIEVLKADLPGSCLLSILQPDGNNLVEQNPKSPFKVVICLDVVMTSMFSAMRRLGLKG